MTELYFTKPEIWNGGFYELALEFGPPSEERLYAALQALWQHPTLQGCYLESGIEPSEQVRVTPSQKLMQSQRKLFGLARMPNGKRIACGSLFVCEDESSDWLIFYVPMGSLSEAYEVNGYPFNEDMTSAESWREPVDAWLTSIGIHIFNSAPFQLGLIGMEVSGYNYAQEIALKGIPAQRDEIYLWPTDGQLQILPRSMM